MFHDFFRQSKNWNFDGVDLYVTTVRDRSDVEVIVYREDYSMDRWLNGVKKAHVLIKTHRVNELPHADGMMNLYSRSVFKTYDPTVTVYEATWVKEVSKKLYDDYETEDGFIAVRSGVCFHSTKNVGEAIRGVQRKWQRELDYQRQLREQEKERKELKKLFRDSIPEDMILTFKDSLRAGNCETGTQTFCDKHGLKRRKKYPARFVYDLEPNNLALKKVIELKMTGR